MTIPELIKEYIWLVETIHQAGRITLAELNDKWRARGESGGANMSRTTFNRHRDDILDMFGIIIECDRKDGYRYYIANEEVLRDNSVPNWLFSTLSVGNMLEENVAVQDRILLESIPSGDAHLKSIIRAIREGRRIMMTYHRYGAPSANRYSASPLCVKLFKRRWYVMALSRRLTGDNPETRSKIAMYALDRIVDMTLTEETFALEADFNAGAYFGECFGVVLGDGTKPQKIILRAYGLEQHYMRSLPIHPSQREIRATKEYTDFEIRVRPTSDLKAHIMSRGEWLEVKEPAWLAEEMGNLLLAAAGRYKK